MQAYLKLLLVLVFSQFVVACTTVNAWEKGNLAKAEMTFAPDPMEAKMRDHIYFAKEGSSSSSAASGGGCGCN